MAEVMQEVGGGGFLISTNHTSRRIIAHITDGLVAAFQARGLARREYGHAQFRDNPLEF